MRIAIIPARGGSRRVPRKNIRSFLGKPIIEYPLSVLTRSGLFDHVVVSTDDDEIARVCTELGAELPFRRPAILSDDHASTDDVLLHALGECEQAYGPIATVCCVYPATPFLSVENVKRGLDLLNEHRATSAFPIVKFEFPIEQAFLFDGLRATPRWPEAMEARSQDLREDYHDAGLFYWCDVEKFKNVGKLFSDDSVAFVIPAAHCHDINTLEDWETAELKYQVLGPRTTV